MKKTKFASLIAVALSAVLVISACGSKGGEKSGGSGQGSSGETITLKLGHVAAKDYPYDVAARGFAKEVEEATNGKVKIEVFEAGQVGSERDMIEAVQLGNLDFYAGGTPPFVNFVPELSVFDMPFLFKDYEHVWKAYDGEIGKSLGQKIDAAGFKLLGYWDQGFKNISNNQKEIRKPEDMKGLKIRTQENPLLVDIYKALGAYPTPMPYPEVYTSIQQGVVHGYEGAIVPFADIKLYEVQKYLTEVRVNFASALHVMNKSKFDSLDPEIQQIILEKGEKYAKEQRKINMQKTEEMMELSKSEGVQIVKFEDIDLQAFRDAVKPIYDKYNENADLIAQIQALE